MISFHRSSTRRRAQRIAGEANRKVSAHRSRKQIIIAVIIFAIIATVAGFHAHRVLAAQIPDDMPSNSTWVLTGHDRNSNAKLGLWFACWKSTTVRADHCRITNETGTVQYDGDMLPLAVNRPLDDADLQFAKIDPEKIWVRGVNDGAPVPVLALADGTQLVPVSDREGLEKRFADGDWVDGLEPGRPLTTNAPARPEDNQ
jgi:hypothetical protein